MFRGHAEFGSDLVWEGSIPVFLTNPYGMEYVAAGFPDDYAWEYISHPTYPWSA